MSAPVADKILEFLYNEKKFIFQNKDLVFLKTGTVNDLLYNLTKRKLISKLRHGIYLFPDLLQQVIRHTPELLHFALTHQDPDWHLGGKGALDYYLLSGSADLEIYTRGTRTLSWTSSDHTFHILNSRLRNSDDFIYLYRIENYDFRISTPLLILFEILSDGGSPETHSLLKKFALSKKETIKEVFSSFIDRVKLPEQAIKGFFTFLTDTALLNAFDQEGYLLARMYGNATSPYSKSGIFIRYRQKSEDLTYSPAEDTFSTGQTLDKNYQKLLLTKLGFNDAPVFKNLIINAPAGFLRDDYITACMESCDTRWRFWYTFDILDSDICRFIQNFSMGFGKKIPEFVSEFRKIEPLLPDRFDVKVELLVVLFKNIIRKYFSQQTLVLVFNRYESVMDSETGHFVMKLLSLELEGIKIIVGIDSLTISSNNSHLMPIDIPQVYASGLRFSDHEFLTFLNLKSSSKDNQRYAFLNKYIWGIPYFTLKLCRLIDQHPHIPYEYKLIEYIFSDSNLESVILEKLYKPLQTELERNILLYLAVSEECPFTELRSFFNVDSFSSTIDKICRQFDGYLRFPENRMSLNPVVSVFIKKYINKHNRCEYLDFIIRMKRHLEINLHYRSLMRCSGELIYLKEYSLSLDLMYRYREFFLTYEVSELLLKWTEMIRESASGLSLRQRIMLDLLRARIYDARMEFEESEKIIESLSNPCFRNELIERDFFYDLGFCLASLKKYNKALRYFETALQSDLALPENHSNTGMDYISIANIETLRRNHDNAKVYFKRAYKCFLKSGDLKHQCFVVNNYAEIFYRECNYPQVTRMYHRALNIALYQKDHHSAGIIYFNAGIVFQKTGFFFDCLNCYRKAFEIMKSKDNIAGLIEVHINLSEVFLLRSNFESCLKNLESAELIMKENKGISSRYFLVSALKCNYYLVTGNIDTAVQHFNSLSSEIRQSGNHKFLNSFIFKLQAAEIDFQKGHFRKSEAIYRELSDPDQVVLSDYNATHVKLLSLRTQACLGIKKSFLKTLQEVMDRTVKMKYEFGPAEKFVPLYLIAYHEDFSADITEFCRKYILSSGIERLERLQLPADLAPLLADFIAEYKASRLYRVYARNLEFVFEEQYIMSYVDDSFNYELWLNFKDCKFFSRSFGALKLAPDTIPYKILHFLLLNIGKSYSSSELYRIIWNTDPMDDDDRTLRVHISRLRKLIEPEQGHYRFIKSVRDSEKIYYYFESSADVYAFMETTNPYRD